MDMSSRDTSAIDTPEPLPPSGHFSFENTYARLPEHFYARLAPTPVAAPQPVLLCAPSAAPKRSSPVQRLFLALRGALHTPGAVPNPH